MSVSFGEIGQVCATFRAGDGVKPDQVCKISAGGTVAACAAGDQFCGVTASLRGGCAGVVVRGFVTASYTGTEPSVGYAALAADGAGGVKTAASGGREVLVAEVDTVNQTLTMLL